MRTEKEAEKLIVIGNIMLKLMQATDPFNALDLLDQGTELLRDLIREIEDDEFKSEAEDKLQKLLIGRQEIVDSL